MAAVSDGRLSKKSDVVWDILVESDILILVLFSNFLNDYFTPH